MDALKRKAARLRKLVRSMESAAVAFSGGADSTLVARIAKDELGSNAVAVTIESPLLPSRELKAARNVAKSMRVEHVVIQRNPLDDPAFSGNPVDRCYVCKLEGFRLIRKLADDRGLREVLDGTNAEDGCDYRPGSKARKELGIRSPLAEAGLSKSEVRRLSADLRLPTAKKSASACLASRIPYGETLTTEKLEMVERAEEFLAAKGFKGARVRAHGPIARIEVSGKEIARLCSARTRAAIVRKLKGLGFTYVTIDAEGYRTGSMDEVLRL